MTTLPTPAEVAEARAFFRENSEQLDAIRGDARAAQEYAAVLVRAALAAPAEQPRADVEREIEASKARRLGWVQAMLDRLRPHLPPLLFAELSAAVYVSDRPITAAEERRALEALAEQPREIGVLDVPGSAPLGAPASSNTPVPVSPSAVPAVSAGGAGRDLTAADVVDALSPEPWRADDTGGHPDPPEDPGELCGCGHPHPDPVQGCWTDGCDCARFGWPDTLAADTGTQATEQTTEYRVVLLRADYSWPITQFGVSQALRNPDVRVECRTKTASPWSPVDVHDEEQQR